MLVISFLFLGLWTTLDCSSPVPQITNDTVFRVEIEDCGFTTVGHTHDTPDRIIGGRYAINGEYPWMVSIREETSDGFKHMCGGAIINEHWIITASHCIDTPPALEMYDIVAGGYKRSEFDTSPTVKIYKLAKIILHADYVEKFYFNDIALLKTTLPIDIQGSKGFITGVCLPQPGSDPRGHATISGWGDTTDGGSNSDALKTVDVPIIPRKTCCLAFEGKDFDGDRFHIVDTMICAGSQGRDSCQNDSGGPMVQYNDDGQATLIGLVSFGIGCGRAHPPGVYTRVSSYIDWINKNAV